MLTSFARFLAPGPTHLQSMNDSDFVRRPKSRIDKNLDRPKLSEQVPDLYKRINSRIRTMGAKNKKDRKQIATISVSKITPT